MAVIPNNKKSPKFFQVNWKNFGFSDTFSVLCYEYKSKPAYM